MEKIGPGDLRLFVHAFRLARKAQRIRREPVKAVVSVLTALPLLPRNVPVGDAVLAAARACRKAARWTGGLNTCLVRSLVAGTLLADRENVVLHIGFRPPADGGTTHDGHAWITVAGTNVTDSDEAGAAGASYSSTLRLPMER